MKTQTKFDFGKAIERKMHPVHIFKNWNGRKKYFFLIFNHFRAMNMQNELLIASDLVKEMTSIVPFIEFSSFLLHSSHSLNACLMVAVY
jgi:hypothetical protein